MLKQNLKKDFLYLWLGNTVSLLGDSIFFISIIWWMYEKTGSALSMSLVAIFDTIPMILFGSFIGVLVDRFSKKKILLTINIVQGIIILFLATLTFMEKATNLHFYGVIFLNSLIAIIRYPAISSIIPKIDEENSMVMNSYMQASRNISSIFGAAIGGTVVAFFSIKVSILLNALSFFVTAFMISFIKDVQVKRRDNESFITQFTEGISYFKKDRTLLFFIFLITLLVFLNSPIIVVLPVLVKEVLKMSASAYGIINSINALGATLIIILSGNKLQKGNYRKLFLVLILITGLIYVMLGLTDVYFIVLILFLLLGVADSVMDVITMTIIQLNCDENYRGRVFGILGSVFMIANTGSYIIGGYLIDLFGVTKLVLIIGSLIIFIGLFMLFVRDKIYLKSNSKIVKSAQVID